jgi:hypothetical protein
MSPMDAACEVRAERSLAKKAMATSHRVRTT